MAAHQDRELFDPRSGQQFICPLQRLILNVVLAKGNDSPMAPLGIGGAQGSLPAKYRADNGVFSAKEELRSRLPFITVEWAAQSAG